MKVKSTKHWYSYIWNLFLILFIGMPCVFIYYQTRQSTEIPSYVRIGVLVFGLWFLFKAIIGIILKSRIEWVFENDVLTIKSGLLRSVFYHEIFQIYEAYLTMSLMGILLGYGNIHIRRTDGVTSEIFQSKMTNPKKMVSEINNAISAYNNNKSGKNEILTLKESLTDELNSLVDLNKDGVISDEEFEKLKRKIIE